MSPATIICLVVVAIIVGGVIFHMIRQKKAGKHSCSGCNGCSGGCGCHNTK